MRALARWAGRRALRHPRLADLLVALCLLAGLSSAAEGLGASLLKVALFAAGFLVARLSLRGSDLLVTLRFGSPLLVLLPCVALLFGNAGTVVSAVLCLFWLVRAGLRSARRRARRLGPDAVSRLFRPFLRVAFGLGAILALIALRAL